MVFISRLVLVKHVFPTFSKNAKISIPSYEISLVGILVLAFPKKVGNTCLTSTRRDIMFILHITHLKPGF